MGVPGATDLLFVKASDITRIVDRALQFVLQDDGVQDNAKVFPVKFVDRLLGVGKDPLVPGEGTVLRVPPGGTKPCAEIDERVAREFPFAKGFRLVKHFFAARQSSM